MPPVITKEFAKKLLAGLIRKIYWIKMSKENSKEYNWIKVYGCLDKKLKNFKNRKKNCNEWKIFLMMTLLTQQRIN